MWTIAGPQRIQPKIAACCTTITESTSNNREWETMVPLAQFEQLHDQPCKRHAWVLP
jgi:hypothetical protein